MEGWIKLHRQILDSPVFAHQTALKIWIWCLCKASHSGKSFSISTGKGETIVTIDRGQFIFGRFKAEEELGINGSTIYKWIHKFSDEMDMINIVSNNHYSIITILNFNDFQDIETDKVTTKEQPKNNQVTAKEQPSNTYKNDKNVKNEENFTANDFERWANQIVNDEDQYWQQMKGRKVSKIEMDHFLSVALRNDWKFDSQQGFRRILMGFKDDSKKPQPANFYKVQ
jgi:hypothetical protein